MVLYTDYKGTEEEYEKFCFLKFIFSFYKTIKFVEIRLHLRYFIF